VFDLALFCNVLAAFYLLNLLSIDWHHRVTLPLSVKLSSESRTLNKV